MTARTKTIKQRPTGTRQARLEVITKVSTIISGFGTMVAAIVAVILLLSKDMVHENIRLQHDNMALLDQKLGLIDGRMRMAAANNELREDQLRLEAARSRVEQQLASAKQDQIKAESRVAALVRSAAVKASQLAHSERDIAALRAESKLIAQRNAALDNTLRTSSSQLLSAAMVTYLAKYQPVFADLTQYGFYEYLYDERDPAFGATSKTAARLFIALPDAEFSKDELPRACAVQPGVHVLAFGLEVSETRMAFNGEVDPADALLQQVCRYLGTRLQVALVPGPRRTRSMTVFEILQRPSSEAVVISFLPGAAGELAYEEFKTRGFWLGAITALYGGKAAESADDQNGGVLRKAQTDPRSMPLRYDLDLTSAQSAMESLAKEPAFLVLRDRFVEMDDRWMKYLDGLSILRNGKEEPVRSAGKFRQFLPRFSFAKVGSEEFFEERDTIREFDFRVKCAATEFGIANGYFSYLDPKDGMGCSTRKQIDEVLAKMRLERADHPQATPRTRSNH